MSVEPSNENSFLTHFPKKKKEKKKQRVPPRPISIGRPADRAIGSRLSFKRNRTLP